MFKSKFLGRSLSLVGSATAIGCGLFCNTGTNAANANFMSKVFSISFFVKFFNNLKTKLNLKNMTMKKDEKLYSELEKILSDEELFEMPVLKEKNNQIFWYDQYHFKPTFPCKLNDQTVSFVECFPEDKTFRIGCGYDDPDPRNRKIYLVGAPEDLPNSIYCFCGKKEFYSLIASIVEQAKNYKYQKENLSETSSRLASILKSK